MQTFSGEISGEDEQLEAWGVGDNIKMDLTEKDSGDGRLMEPARLVNWN